MEGGGLTPLQRCSCCILERQPTGLYCTGSTAPPPFTQWIFLVASMALWCRWNLYSISFWIRPCCMFICEIFKSHMEWNNAHVRASSTTILPYMTWTTLVMRYVLQARLYYAKLLNKEGLLFFFCFFFFGNSGFYIDHQLDVWPF